MVLIDDLIIGFSAAVATASVVILGVLLSRYHALARDAAKADQLAKDLWDSMNTRLSTQDTRIVDLMARFEVYAARRSSGPTLVSAPRPSVTPPASQASRENPPMSQPPAPAAAPTTVSSASIQSERHTNTTEITILRTLLEGPKTSNQIREVIQVTREHNGRLLKELFDRGLVVRSSQHKPFVYEITEAGRKTL